MHQRKHTEDPYKIPEHMKKAARAAAHAATKRTAKKKPGDVRRADMEWRVANPLYKK